MKSTAFGIGLVAAAFFAFVSDTSADSWADTTACTTQGRDFTDTASNGSASSTDSRAELSVTVDSRGGSDVSVRLGDPPQQHDSWGSQPWRHDGADACLPRHHRRLGPN